MNETQMQQFPASTYDAPKAAETPEAKLVRLNQEVARLKLDVNYPFVATARFDERTGKNIETDPLGQIERVYGILIRRAERDFGEALGYSSSARFSIHTGEAMPQRQKDEQGIFTEESLRARLKVFRKDTEILVQQAQAKGVFVPSFDAKTGEPIPKDSLRALKKVINPQPQANV